MLATALCSRPTRQRWRWSPTTLIPLQRSALPLSLPSRSAEALAIFRLEKGQEELHRLMKSFMSEVKHRSTQDKTFQESLLHTMRKDQTAHTPLAALDDTSKGGRGRGGGRGAGSYAAGQNRQGRREDGYDRLNDTEPIPPKDFPSEIRAAFESANIRGDAYYNKKPCRVCGKPGHPTSKCNRLYVLTPEGRKTSQASCERVKSMGVQIDGKRVANLAHLSDLDNRARVEVEQALRAGEIFHASTTR
eukprot:849950-Pleurochrysis_carterae.AAC.3